MALLLRTLFAIALFGELLTAEPRQSLLQQQAWSVLESGLTHSKPAHRQDAVKALSLLSDDRHAIRLAVRALQDENSGVRASAATTLGQLHAVSAVAELRSALQDKEISVVLAACQALYYLHDKSQYSVYYAILMGDRKADDGIIQAQLDRFKDPKKIMEMGFQEGISFVPYGGIGVEAYRAAKSDGSPVRAAAARYLALDPDPMSGDALVQVALTDGSTNVRMAALDAISQRGDSACADRLQRNLNDPKSAIRYRTAATILHLLAVKKKSSPRRIF